MKNKLPKRFLTRCVAAQALYQYDFYDQETSLKILLRNLIQNYSFTEDEDSVSIADKIDEEFLETLLSGLTFSQDKIDDQIKALLKDEWKIEDLSEVMLQILRLGTFELKYLKDIPTKVVINEYVDLAGCFYDTKKVTFVNSILQNIANTNR
ncbi:MAG: N utilization substance protein B [Rickettsiales bacterium]|jgi:N utilization substance protein B